MPYAKATDGTKLFYKDWGKGKPVVLIHGWPLTGDTFDEAQFKDWVRQAGRLPGMRM